MSSSVVCCASFSSTRICPFAPELPPFVETANAAARDLDLEKRMADVQAAVELGRRLRADNDLKVRQPLACLKLAGGDVKGLEELIEDELNVKKVEFIADETELCDVTFKANFKTLGKKCGPKMKAVAAAIAGAKKVPFECEGFTITEEDVIVTRTPKDDLVVASQGAIVVGLETALTPELIAEGNAREFVSHVQSMRKEADFEVVQRIAVTVSCDAEMKAALEAYLDKHPQRFRRLQHILRLQKHPQQTRRGKAHNPQIWLLRNHRHERTRRPQLGRLRIPFLHRRRFLSKQLPLNR